MISKLLIFLIFISLIACASPPKPKVPFEQGIEQSEKIENEPIDVLSSENEVEIVESKTDSVNEGNADEKEEETEMPSTEISAEIMTDGYRIQIFAGSTHESSEQQADKIRSITEESVYVEQDGDLWKVQVGDYIDRATADQRKVYFNEQGFEGSWVVSRKVKSVSSAPVMQEKPSESVEEAGPHFRAQVFVSSSREKAETFADNLRVSYEQPVFVEAGENLWKVQIGRFHKKEDAYQFIEQLKIQGVEGAFVVEK